MTSSPLLAWYKQLLCPYKSQVVGALVALIIASGSWLLLGQAIRYGIDAGFVESAQESARQTAIRTAGTGLIVLIVVISIATYWRFYLMSWLGERVSADIRKKVYGHLLTLGPSFFHSTRTGEVISRFTADTTVIQTVVGSSLSMAVRSVFTFVGALLLMLTSNALLTGAVLICVPVILFPIRFFAGPLRKYSRLSQDKIADIGSQVDQSLHEIATVQAFNAELREHDAFSNRVNDALTTALERIRIRAKLIALVMGISMIAIVLIGWLGVMFVTKGTMTVGELSAFLFYAVIAGGAIATISEVIGEIQRAAGASERLNELLQAQNPVKQGNETAIPTSPMPPKIAFENVTFSYAKESNDTPLVRDLSVDINAGEKIALVGPSGAGKSTLFKLLLRFYDTQDGQICINGVSISTLTLQALREQIAIVDQDAVVFADTVFHNIAYGKPNATLDDVKAAAKLAFADEFIQNLPNGYNTQLGERGVNLSGGQRQRIAIARAILTDSPILLLDEATSALDANSEAYIQQALHTLMETRTSQVIAHRLSTVKDVDRIIVLNEGSIEAVGTHPNLLKDSATYRKYAELQLLD